MYGALWRVLPGPWFVKLIIVLVVVAAILYGLFWYAFPWVSATFFPPADANTITQ
ncbi:MULTISPECIES: hypothetical protein [Microbacterium]|jgi:hypothetical protein|uniref:hypothetical protein n=1 Tax=Microbacterium TaxID=33882 RepID=UPI001E57F513|nr:hypothetical protein [Microbacterium nymphoidis]MCD2498528.1 hypothetical protein [Microbacterium nymphoidis]